MAQDLFRKESKERIAAPDELQDYMHVTSPRIWMLLIIVVVLLVGFIVYASLAVMENTLDVKADVTTFSEDSNEYVQDIILFIPPEKIDIIQNGMTVRIDGEEGTIIQKHQSEGEVVAIVSMSESAGKLKDGTHDAQIVLEAISPLRFLLN